MIIESSDESLRIVQRVELAEAGHGRVDRPLVVFARAHVAQADHHTLAEFGEQAVRLFLATHHHADPGRTFFNEALDDGTPDPGPTAGHECDVAFQPTTVRHARPLR